MLDPNHNRIAEIPADTPPLLLVVIDTEEEFPWEKPLSRGNTATTTIADQYRAQDVFDQYGLVPTYVIDYPVATSEAAISVLRAFQDSGRCMIGTHLHPWVNPPHDEEVSPRTSYPGNLPASLERQKLEILTETIAQNFGRRPTIYKAGRYGVGPATANILEDLGYEIDVSVVPRTAFVDDGGPDFSSFGDRPYWFGVNRRLLEIPLTVGFSGALAGMGPALFPTISGSMGMAVRAPGICARLGLMERIRLTPEGADHAAHRRLTRSLLARGCRVFCMTYHSPSLAPGHTPYVRTEQDLEAFVGTIKSYCDYFFGELQGRPATPHDIAELAGGGRGE